MVAGRSVGGKKGDKIKKGRYQGAPAIKSVNRVRYAGATGVARLRFAPPMQFPSIFDPVSKRLLFVLYAGISLSFALSWGDFYAEHEIELWSLKTRMLDCEIMDAGKASLENDSGLRLGKMAKQHRILASS